MFRKRTRSVAVELFTRNGARASTGRRAAEEISMKFNAGTSRKLSFENLRAHIAFSSFPIWWAFFKILLLVFLPEYFLHSETAVNIFDIHSVLYRFKCNKFTLFFKYFKSKYCIRYYTNFIITKKNEITKFKNYLFLKEFSFNGCMNHRIVYIEVQSMVSTWMIIINQESFNLKTISIDKFVCVQH